YKIDEMPVTVLSLPLLVIGENPLWGYQMLIYKRIALLLLKLKISDVSVIHSVGASFAGIIGSYFARKLKVRHIAQCIGSDINFKIPELKNKRGIQGWEKSVNQFICNSISLKKQIKTLYPERAASVIYRGIDLYKFQPSPNKWESRKELRFLFIGGLSYRKESGVERNLKGGVTLLRAWKKAISNLSYFPNNLELSFAGPEVTPELVSKILND